MVKTFAAEMEAFDPDAYVDAIVHQEMERAPKEETKPGNFPYACHTHTHRERERKRRVWETHIQAHALAHVECVCVCMRACESV
jgi:hypothetical protein